MQLSINQNVYSSMYLNNLTTKCPFEKCGCQFFRKFSNKLDQNGKIKELCCVYYYFSDQNLNVEIASA